MAGDTVMLVRRVGAAPPVLIVERDSALAYLDSSTNVHFSAQADRMPSTKPFIRAFFTSPNGKLWCKES